MVSQKIKVKSHGVSPLTEKFSFWEVRWNDVFNIQTVNNTKGGTNGEILITSSLINIDRNGVIWSRSVYLS